MNVEYVNMPFILIHSLLCEFSCHFTHFKIVCISIHQFYEFAGILSFLVNRASRSIAETLRRFSTCNGDCFDLSLIYIHRKRTHLLS